MPDQPLDQNEAEAQPEEMHFNKQDVQFFPSGRHIWRQQGCYLVCKNCPLHHAVYIGMDKLMVGEKEDGTPILRAKACV